MTVGELRELLAEYPDDMRVFVHDDASWIHPDVEPFTTHDLPKWARTSAADEEVLVIG